jgi:hypothetical protein
MVEHLWRPNVESDDWGDDSGKKYHWLTDKAGECVANTAIGARDRNYSGISLVSRFISKLPEDLDT